MRIIFFLSILLLISRALSAQPAEHSWWNLLHYSISVTPDIQHQTISGSNLVKLVALKNGRRLQIDLQEPLLITKISWKNETLRFEKKGTQNYFVFFPCLIRAGDTTQFTIFFEGSPVAALKPPFDNGWAWKKDSLERPWISVACEGSGASIWFPCKEVLYDEPDEGAELRITIPDSLKAVANGRPLPTVKHLNGTATYGWKVINPINNYNIIPYIGKYRHWQEDYQGLKGNLTLDYWVLDYQLEKARIHLKQVDTLLNAFEYWMGPYPFYEDGFKIVEAPMPGMEHQSAIAYGNHFANGYNGRDVISGTGWGLKWDFILVHESGHEWFGNSLGARNHSDTWIHEGFTKYLETLYTDFAFGTKAGNEYAIGTWKRIKNDEPIIGTNTSDKYYKASAMLHTIRQITGDTVFRKILQELNRVYYHQTITTEQVLKVINEVSGLDCSPIFKQYLHTINIPIFAYKFSGNKLSYRWENCVKDFAMPVRITLNQLKSEMILPTTTWKSLTWPNKLTQLIVDSNFCVKHEIR